MCDDRDRPRPWQLELPQRELTTQGHDRHEIRGHQGLGGKPVSPRVQAQERMTIIPGTRLVEPKERGLPLRRRVSSL